MDEGVEKVHPQGVEKVQISGVLFDLIVQAVNNNGPVARDVFYGWLEAWYQARRTEEAEEDRRKAFRSFWESSQPILTPVSNVDHPAEPDEDERRIKAAIRAEAGQKGLATRKRNALDGLERLRAAGISLQSIADAGDLELGEVLGAVERKPMGLPQLAKIEKAIRNLEAKE